MPELAVEKAERQMIKARHRAPIVRRSLILPENIERLTQMSRLAAILTTWIAGLSLATYAGPPLPDDLRNLAVYIEIPVSGGNVFGSGFYLNDSNQVYFVTAAHMLFNPDGSLKRPTATLRSCVRGTDPNERKVFDLDLMKLRTEGLLKRHRERDVAAIRLGGAAEVANKPTTNFEASPGVISHGDSSIGFFLAEASYLCRFADSHLGMDVYVLGYPATLGFPSSDPNIDFTEAVVRRGILSQKNYKTHRLIVDAAIFHGNSGGPALVSESVDGQIAFKLVGIVTEYVPAKTDTPAGVPNVAIQNSGYSVVQPIDLVLDLIRDRTTQQ